MAGENEILNESTEGQSPLALANGTATVVITQLIEQLVKHYKISRAEARYTIREVLMSL